MLAFYSLLLLTVLILTIKKDLFNPACITCVIWSVITVLYQVTDNGLNKLSPLFFEVLFLWCMAFSIGSLMTSNLKFKTNLSLFEEPKINCRRFYFVLLVLLLFSLVAVLINAKKSGISAIGYVRNIGLNEENVPCIVKIINLITTIIYPTVFIFLGIEKRRIRKILIFMFFLLISILSGSKSQMMQIFITSLFLLFYHKKFKPIVFILLTLVLIIGIILITLFRDNGNSKIDFIELIYIYFFSPLPAFDMLLNGTVHANVMPFAGTVFGLFYRILGKVFGSPVPNSGLDFVFVPVPTNVYTIMVTGYLDFGQIGMFLFALLYGMLWGFFYSFVKKGFKFYKLLYGCFLNVLILQFFADYLFPYLAIFIYQIFISIFIYYKSKIKDFKYLRSEI